MSYINITISIATVKRMQLWISHTLDLKKQKNNRGRFTERKTRDSFLRTQYSKVGKEKPHSCKSCIAYLSCVENYPVA